MKKMRKVINMKSAIVLILFIAVAASPCALRRKAAAETGGNVDIDLSQASSIVVFLQVSNMYNEPWNYLNAVIRIRGTLDSYVKANGQECSLVMVQDATACCGQGLEFVCKEDDAHNGGYPDNGEEVVVTGRFEIYQEDGGSFIHLVDAELEWDHL